MCLAISDQTTQVLAIKAVLMSTSTTFPAGKTGSLQEEAELIKVPPKAGEEFTPLGSETPKKADSFSR